MSYDCSLCGKELDDYEYVTLTLSEPGDFKHNIATVSCREEYFYALSYSKSFCDLNCLKNFLLGGLVLYNISNKGNYLMEVA